MRTRWQADNPEEAARRRKNKNAAVLPSFERDVKENALDAIHPQSLSEQETVKIKKEMMSLWQLMYNRRHEYLEHRSLKLAAIDEEDKARFKSYILRYGGMHGFSMECNNLLIDGLKYPETDACLANLCFKYLDDKYSHGVKPSAGFWLQLWSREFVPLDAVRLMMKHDAETGTYRRVQGFVELFPMLVDKIKQHCERERHLLSIAEDSQAGRCARRLFFFTVLINLYGARP